MSSTLEKKISELKKNPSQLQLLGAILEQLLLPKHPQQLKLKSSEEVCSILGKIEEKIDPNKQSSSYEYLKNVRVKTIEVSLHIINNSACAAQWFDLISLVLRDSKDRKYTINPLISSILENNSIDFAQMKNGELLSAILSELSNRILENNKRQLMQFLLSLEHVSSFQFPNQQTLLQAKRLFQNLLIDCLNSIQNLLLQEQVQIYNRLGDKVFSKLASPLALSQFFLKKIQDQQENPTIQIEVLSALFILVGKYGLQLEKFYENLENIIAKKRCPEESLFRLKNSKRFLKLVEAAMRSSKVPFKHITNLSRLLLRLIPSERSEYTFWVISFFVNLVKKHRQLQSQLCQFPEVQVLKYHYSPRVRTLVKQLSKNLNKAEYLDIEQFGKVNCKKLCDKKLQQILNKFSQCEEGLQFRKPTQIQEI